MAQKMSSKKKTDLALPNKELMAWMRDRGYGPIAFVEVWKQRAFHDYPKHYPR